MNVNCSGSHQGTKTQRIDMSFTPLSENEEGIARKTVDVAPNAFGPALARPARNKMM